MFSIIAHLMDDWRLSRALRDYPEYAPPCRGTIEDAVHGEQNYLYFLQEKDRRLSYLCKFLADYNVDGRVEAGDFSSIGAWLYRYGGYLVASPYSLRSLLEFDPPWNGQFVGLNVVYDVGVLIGEHLISRGFGARWGLYVEGGILPGGDEEWGFLHPCVYGIRREYFTERSPLFPAQHVFECCDSSRWRLRGQGTIADSWERVDELARRVEYWSGEDERRE